LTVVDGRLDLKFIGEDPGIAMDLRGRKLPAGPYWVTFRLRGGSPDGGELFFTTDPENILPKGEHMTFDVNADQEWQDVKLRLATKKTLHQLRLDVCSGEGRATIADLQLQNDAGTTITAWPEHDKE